jgi:hypothetical protein
MDGLPIYLFHPGHACYRSGPNTCPGLCDEGELHTVTSVFADTAALGKYAEQMHNTSAPNIKQVLEGNAFDARMPETGVAAETLTVQFNIQNLADWRFDPETGKYLRWIESVDLNQNITWCRLLTGSQRNNWHSRMCHRAVCAVYRARFNTA